MSSPFIGAIYDILKTPFQKGKKDSGNMKTPFIGAHGLTGAMLQVRSDYHRALNKGLGMTRVDPPWMLTALLTQHQTSSHNRTSPTANCSQIYPTVTQQKSPKHWDRSAKSYRRKGTHGLGPSQLSPDCGHICEYAWVALVELDKIGGGDNISLVGMGKRF